MGSRGIAPSLLAWSAASTAHYGEEHAQNFGHRRRLDHWPKARAPLYPAWGHADENGEVQRVHLVGHSQGAITIRLLQQMLADNAFPPFSTSADWIHSITSIAGVNNGSTLTYASLDSADGLLDKNGIEQFLELIRIHLVSGFDIKLGFRAFSLLKNILEAPVITSSDYDHPDTYYFSYVTSATKERRGGKHYPICTMNPLLWQFARDMGHFDRDLDIPGFEPAAWRANDGAVPVVSQRYPQLGRTGKTQHQEHRGAWPTEKPQTGVWHVMEDPFRGWDHLDVVVFPEDDRRRQQMIFYEDLVDHLWSL